jgi:hypothetical protein
MRFKLEYEDDPVFATVRHQGERYRSLLVKINGKPFSTWVHLDFVYDLRCDDPNYMRAVDENLVAAMERMFERVFNDACAAVPEGTDLMIDKHE